jgi:ABC-type branched-subunit amino acid transport system ATPase component
MMGAWVFRRDRRRIARQLEEVYAMFPMLRDKRRERADLLSGGQGRMLSVARELMTSPSLLLIDEPTAGLAPNLVAQVYDILTLAKSATGAAILLVEQNVEEALPFADHLYLLNLGQVKNEGPGREFDCARVRTLVLECLLG